MLYFYHLLFWSTPLLVTRCTPKSAFPLILPKLFAYFHLSSCNFEQLCRFCTLPHSCKELSTVTLSSVLVTVSSWGHNQCRECKVRIRRPLCSSSFKTAPNCSLPSTQDSWKQEYSGYKPGTGLGWDQVMSWHDWFLTWHDSFETWEISKWPLKQLLNWFSAFGQYGPGTAS